MSLLEVDEYGCGQDEGHEADGVADKVNVREHLIMIPGPGPGLRRDGGLQPGNIQLYSGETIHILATFSHSLSPLKARVINHG